MLLLQSFQVCGDVTVLVYTSSRRLIWLHERQYRTDYYTRRRNHNGIAIDVACMILDLTQDYEYEEEEDEEVPGTAVIPHAAAAGN